MSRYFRRTHNPIDPYGIDVYGPTLIWFDGNYEYLGSLRAALNRRGAKTMVVVVTDDPERWRDTDRVILISLSDTKTPPEPVSGTGYAQRKILVLDRCQDRELVRDWCDWSKDNAFRCKLIVLEQSIARSEQWLVDESAAIIAKRIAEKDLINAPDALRDKIPAARWRHVTSMTPEATFRVA